MERNNKELRIVMVGKTGAGKSATGNTILGRECFESKFGGKSITVDCSKGKATVDGQRVAVIDTPGLFDTRFGKDKTANDISQCISYSSPGPHVFLVVIKLGRFTDEEKNTVQRIQEIFGEAADQYSMVLFTGGDNLDTTMKDFLAECPDLQQLVDRCKGQYHVFNNKAEDPSQVPELLQKIRGMVQRNGGSHYTNEMFQEAERILREKTQSILREKEEQIQREREELEEKLREKYEQQMLTFQKQIEAEREKDRNERERESMMMKQQMAEVMEKGRKEREMEEKEIMEMKQEMDKVRKEGMTNREDQDREMAKMKEAHRRELEEEFEKFQKENETEARREAEESNPLMDFLRAFVGIAAEVGSAAMTFVNLYKMIYK